MLLLLHIFTFFFFNDTATTEIYTLSLHDALPILLKVLERVIEARLRKTVKIDEMQFGFCPGKGTTDAIFIVRQVQEKFLGKQKEMWMAFVDLEKAFDRVPREVLWWALRHVGAEERMVNVIKSLYEGVTTVVKGNGEES